MHYTTYKVTNIIWCDDMQDTDHMPLAYEVTFDSRGMTQDQIRSKIEDTLCDCEAWLVLDCDFEAVK